MLRQVKNVWVIVNIDLLCVPFVALLAGDNRCIWGKKDKREREKANVVINIDI